MCYKLLTKLMRKRYSLILALYSLPFIALLFTLSALAQDGQPSIADIRTYAIELERRLTDTAPPNELLAEQISTLTKYRSSVARCVQNTKLILEERTESIKAIEGSVEALDSPLQGNAAKQLEGSRAEQADASKRLVDCQLLEQRVSGLINKLSKLQNDRLISNIKFKEKTGVETAIHILRSPSETLKSVRGLVDTVITRLFGQKNRFVQLLPAFIIGLVAAIWLRSKLIREIQSFDASAQKISFEEAFIHVSSRYVLWLFPLIGMSCFLLADEIREIEYSNLAQLIFVLTGYFATFALISFLLNPRQGYARILTIRKHLAVPMARSLKILVTLSTIGGIFYLFLRNDNLPPEIVNASRLFAVTVFCINALVFLVFLSRARIISSFSRLLCYFLSILFLIALTSAWFGYRNFCELILLGALGTSLSGLLLWLLGQFTREVFDGLDFGKRKWHRRVRARLAVENDEPIPGLIWFRLIAIGLVWSLVVIILLRGWGLSVTGFVLLRQYFFDGFQIGDFTVVPIKIAVGILFFGTILLLSRLLKGRLSSQSVLLNRLEPSARETLVTLTGYLGFTIALLIGLSLAGINFQNFAIVAGALSVGIGFGLQNIVNNFVSGIILLFERPIRRGDWVVVGGTEGFVKNINVRSTEIETWDRSDVIVPNSEFISSQVTNWTLSNAYGRVIAQVGVAYGSDTKKVQEILLEIAEKHPQVIQKNNFFQIPEPTVLFQAFGDSSLDFELRCFIRDIRKRLIIRSEINFEIDRLFRENNIEIPFPQRDVHVRSGGHSDVG